MKQFYKKYKNLILNYLRIAFDMIMIVVTVVLLAQIILSNTDKKLPDSSLDSVFSLEKK